MVHLLPIHRYPFHVFGCGRHTTLMYRPSQGYALLICHWVIYHKDKGSVSGCSLGMMCSCVACYRYLMLPAPPGNHSQRMSGIRFPTSSESRGGDGSPEGRWPGRDRRIGEDQESSADFRGPNPQVHWGKTEDRRGGRREWRERRRGSDPTAATWGICSTCTREPGRVVFIRGVMVALCFSFFCWRRPLPVNHWLWWWWWWWWWWWMS